MQPQKVEYKEEIDSDDKREQSGRVILKNSMRLVY